jgi:Family of unknown function (DUF6320)
MVTNKATTKFNAKARIILSTVLLFSAIVCLTINYSIDQSFGWSLFPAGALVVLWATIVPMLIVKKNKTLLLFSGFAITLIPYLFLIQYVVSGKGWFIPLALPIAILSLGALAISLFVFNNFKNKLYSSAMTVFLFGVVVNFAVGKIINSFLDGTNNDDISRIMTISASAIAALILFVIGYTKNVHHSAMEKK